MTYLEVIILAAVQGLTEFLPVSSSGQLVAVRELFGLSSDNGGIFDAWLHLGTLGAVLVYYRSTWLGILKGLVSKGETGLDKRNLLFKILLATIPAGLIGYFMSDIIETSFRSSTSVAIGLLLTALALVLADYPWQFKVERISKRASVKDAILIGLAQVLALLPGISRSGITMAAGMGRGLSRKQATSFSFLMAAPIIAGAGLLGVRDLVVAAEIGVDKLVLGIVISFVVALLTISGLLKFVEKKSFSPFVVYIVGLAIVLAIYG